VNNNSEKTSQQKLGAFYTPPKVVEEMVMRMGFCHSSRILEPSGGDGAFVKELINQGILAQNITVWDINPDVKENIEGMEVNFIHKDTLLDTPIDNGLFQKTEKYTRIIGNPPYLNKSSEYLKKNKKQLQKIYKRIGANDTYAMFIYLCCHLLEKNGRLCFLISDTYRTLRIHKKLREYLLKNFTIDDIIICPLNLFNDATVKTGIIILTNKKPDEDHEIRFLDCSKVKHFSCGITHSVRQQTLSKMPNSNFIYWGYNIWRTLKDYPKMVQFLDGGLGMHTGNNDRYIKKNVPSLHKENRTDRQLKNGYRYYHKKGGNARFYYPIEHVLRWTKHCVNKKYDGLTNVKNIVGLFSATKRNRKGFIISGITSSLVARAMQDGAAWESNKAMAFFPKDPKKYPIEFFIGILNTPTYDMILRLLNHTNSIQIRDVNELPMLPFSDEEKYKIVDITKKIICNLKKDISYSYEYELKKIDSIVKNICP